MLHPSGPLLATLPLALLLFADGARAQSWRLASPPTTPPARAGQVMATDLSAGLVVMFGGYAGASYLSDTWLFDGSDWSQLVGSGPQARMRGAMAFDESRNSLILYGGINGTGTSNWLAGTWELLGGVWSQRPSTLFPPRRFGHAMAYDPVRSRIVMFGGRTNAGTIFIQDTWEWTGNDWVALAPVHKPSPRMGHSMAFDPNTNRVLLFGGLQLGGPYQGDTWAFDGIDWTQLSPLHAPSPRGDQAMATDRGRGRIVLRGGHDGTDLTDTWEWDGSDWKLVGAATPADALALAAMATGPSGWHVALFGGEDPGGVVASTWRFGQLASSASYGTGCGTPPLVLSATAGSDPVLGANFGSAVSAVPIGGVATMSFGLSNQSLGGVPLPIDLTPIGMNGCHLYHDFVAGGFAMNSSGGVWSYSLPLPLQSSLVGVQLFEQVDALAPGANLLGLITSNGLGLSLGMR